MSGITHLVKVFQQKCSQIPRFHGCVASAVRGGSSLSSVVLFTTCQLFQCSSSEKSFSVYQLCKS